jgi:hypothetical protein
LAQDAKRRDPATTRGLMPTASARRRSGPERGARPPRPDLRHRCRSDPRRRRALANARRAPPRPPCAARDSRRARRACEIVAHPFAIDPVQRALRRGEVGIGILARSAGAIRRAGGIVLVESPAGVERGRLSSSRGSLNRSRRAHSRMPDYSHPLALPAADWSSSTKCAATTGMSLTGSVLLQLGFRASRLANAIKPKNSPFSTRRRASFFSASAIDRSIRPHPRSASAPRSISVNK